MQNKPTPVDIKELRKRTGMTQQQMANRMGVAKQTVHRWEIGQSKPSQLAIRQLHRLDRKVNG